MRVASPSFLRSKMTLWKLLHCLPVLFLALRCAAETRFLRVCVVQYNEGTNDTQMIGEDARGVSAELSALTPSGTTSLTAIPIVGHSRQDADRETQHSDCPFTVELRRYEGTEANANNSSNSSSSANTAMPVQPESQELILYSLIVTETRKVVYRGSALPPIFHGHGQVSNSPYNAIAVQISRWISRSKKNW